MKNILYSFYNLYNSLNYYKSLINKDRENIKKYIIYNKVKNQINHYFIIGK